MNRRIILPPKGANIDQKNVSILPPVEGLIADALQVIQTEIVRFSSKTKRGQSLDLKEARVLQGYIKALVELSRETRERVKDQDFSSMSDEELVNLLGALLEKRKSTGNSSKNSDEE